LVRLKIGPLFMDSQGTGDYNCQVLEDLWRNGVSRIICRMTMFTRTDLSLCHPYHTILVTNNRCERRREVEGAVHGGKTQNSGHHIGQRRI